MIEIAPWALVSMVLLCVLTGLLAGAGLTGWATRRAAADAEEETANTIAGIQPKAIPPDYLPLPRRVAARTRRMKKIVFDHMVDNNSGWTPSPDQVAKARTDIDRSLQRFREAVRR